MTTAAIIVAAGRGTRLGGDRPKQFRELGGKAMICRTLEAFDRIDGIGPVVVVVHPYDESLYRASVPDWADRPPVVHGGATRQASVLAGLERLVSEKPEIVLIHDGARPFVSAQLIARVEKAAKDAGSAIPVVPVTDTVKEVDGADNVTGSPDRTLLRAAQTPQGFAFEAILTAHRRAARDGDTAFTDDASVAAWAGLSTVTVAGDVANTKITTERDLMLAEAILGGPETKWETRVGQGFDVHRFTDGTGVRLCGVDISHDRSLEGHSDADVAMHALTDALYGALAEGDIGRHFPPSDPQWKGAPSRIFLEHACRLAGARGRIVAVDVTIICEVPKIGPHAAAMQRTLSKIMGLAVDRISIKATTSEGLGFTGRREGIAAMATATVAVRTQHAEPEHGADT